MRRAALETLALVADDPTDATVAVKRDHAIARTRMFTDSAWAGPRLQEISERWQQLGDEGLAAWAMANAGVARFMMSRMEEAAADLDQALTMFERHHDRAGAVAASSFLCLARPTDRRVPRWLAEALAFADEAGDRIKQVGALSSLAWHHFQRSLWGGPADTAAAEGFALSSPRSPRMSAPTTNAMHGRSLLAIIARLEGRIGVAAAETGEPRPPPAPGAAMSRGWAGPPASRSPWRKGHQPLRLRSRRRLRSIRSMAWPAWWCMPS